MYLSWRVVSLSTTFNLDTMLTIISFSCSFDMVETPRLLVILPAVSVPSILDAVDSNSSICSSYSLIVCRSCSFRICSARYSNRLTATSDKECFVFDSSDIARTYSGGRPIIDVSPAFNLALTTVSPMISSLSSSMFVDDNDSSSISVETFPLIEAIGVFSFTIISLYSSIIRRSEIICWFAS